MSGLREWLDTLLGVAPETPQRLLATAITILAVILIRALILRVVNQRVESARALYRWRKTVLSGGWANGKKPQAPFDFLPRGRADTLFCHQEQVVSPPGLETNLVPARYNVRG